MKPLGISMRNPRGPSRPAALRSGAAVFAMSALLSASFAVSAHHGTTVTYDISNTITLTGTVKEWDFVFPHPALYFDVTNANGKVEHWGAETGANPAYYMRSDKGINRNSIKPGDKLKITCYPHRTAGAKACLAKEVSINGNILSALDFKPAAVLRDLVTSPPAAAPK